MGPWGRRWSTSVVVALKVMFGADRKLKDSVQKPREDAHERVLRFGTTCGAGTTPLRPTRVLPPLMPWKSAEPPCAPLMCGSPLAEAVSPHCKDGGDSKTCAGQRCAQITQRHTHGANHVPAFTRTPINMWWCSHMCRAAGHVIVRQVALHHLSWPVWRVRLACETYGLRCRIPTAQQQDGQTAKHAR